MANATILSKLKSNSTKLNTQAPNTVNPIGKAISNFEVRIRINSTSGEADLYTCIDPNTNKECVIKLYRREDAVKSEVLDERS